MKIRSMFRIIDLYVTVDAVAIIKGLNLIVDPGTIHVLMGPNGSGKSTLAATIMGHPQYSVQSGLLEFNSVSLLDTSPDKRAKMGIFLAFQNPIEIPGVTVSTFLKESYQAITGNQLSLSNFNEILLPLLQQLQLDQSFIYRNLNEGFSGGEKKRLEMVQMLLLNPSLIILDEIDSGLDIDACNFVAQVLATIKQRNSSVGIILITHYPRMLNAIKPDYVHIMHEGLITKSGNSSLAQEIEQKGYYGIATT